MILKWGAPLEELSEPNDGAEDPEGSTHDSCSHHYWASIIPRQEKVNWGASHFSRYKVDREVAHTNIHQIFPMVSDKNYIC